MPGTLPEERIEIAREAWEAVSTADVESLARVSTAAVSWHASGRGVRAGDHRGRRAVIEYLASLGDDVDSLSLDLIDVLTGDHRTALLVRLQGARHGKEIDAQFFVLLRLENRKIAEVWSMPNDQHLVDEFWA
ncbi:MAG: nuclear transport factor 2 family protein [bacterium]|jgi:ketosteroid isomerase-like protein